MVKFTKTTTNAVKQKLLLHFLLLVLIFSFKQGNSANIGLLVVATGRYVEFVTPLIKSANKHFCKNHNVTYFVFTNNYFDVPPNTVVIHQDRLGWPYDTMMRYHVYLKNKELFSNQDYLFACDADMLFVDTVGDEILGDRVATIHPGYVGNRGTYETNRRSRAYIAPQEGNHYFAGGFYGASVSEFLKLLETNIAHIDEDLKRGIIAIWHDESHWNRYCIDHKPTVILNPSYCYPESWHLNYPKKLLALDKEHSEYRK